MVSADLLLSPLISPDLPRWAKQELLLLQALRRGEEGGGAEAPPYVIKSLAPDACTPRFDGLAFEPLR